MRYPVWKTKAGQKIPINKMSDQHLCNALRMLKRMAHGVQAETIEGCGSLMCSVSADMASYYTEQAFDEAVASDWSEFTPPIFDKMEELARNRKLEWEE